MVPRDLLTRRALAVTAALAAAVAVVTGVAVRERRAEEASASTAAVVARVVDGDTLELVGGDELRLVQIDAPELRDHECYARQARTELAALVPPGSRVLLTTEPAVSAYPGRSPDLDKVDRFGRLLAYVFNDGENANLALVRAGAASPWFFGGARGRYADELLRAAREAREERVGLWGACPDAELAPLAPLETD